MGNSTGSYTKSHYRYHIVCSPKYRYKVLHGEVHLQVREIFRHICADLGEIIVNGAPSHDHVHLFVEIPPHVAVSDFMRRAKGRSSRKVPQEFEQIRKCYWGQRFWQRGYFSTTSDDITDDVINNYLNEQAAEDGFSPSA